MIAQLPAQAICFPPAALNGGPLETAPPKVGEWVWQPKVDDWRAVIHTPSGTVWNQYGKLSSIADKFGPALDHLREAYDNRIRAGFTAAEWLDVGMMEQRHDLMRGCIIVFDVIPHAGWCGLGATFESRRKLLVNMFDVLPPLVSEWLAENDGQVRNEVRLIWQNATTVSPQELYRFLQTENWSIGHKFYEGLVAKRADSLYQFGRKPKQVTPDWVKHRFDQGGQP